MWTNADKDESKQWITNNIFVIDALIGKCHAKNTTYKV